MEVPVEICVQVEEQVKITSLASSTSSISSFPQVPIQVCTVVDTDRAPIVSTVVGTEYKTGKKGKPKPSKLHQSQNNTSWFYIFTLLTSVHNQNNVTLTLISLIVGTF